jgi:sortase (surface protein transpeptidase)
MYERENPMKTWRAKQYRIALGSRRVVFITLRRFRVNKASRSQAYRQLVLNTRFSTVKQIALRLQTYKRPRGRSWTAIGLSRLKTSAPLSLLLLGIIGSTFFGKQILVPRRLEPIKTFSATSLVASKKVINLTPTIKPLPASVPTAISIPAVNIDANIMTVGQASDGSIQMPPILDWITGWYKYSPTPGQIGPAVIVGHVDNYKNISVFWRLRYLQPGDDIYITRADGSTVHFKVTELEQFDQASFPTAEVYGNINYPGLRLITCGGTFSTATESYNQNTVVFATMVS